MKRITDILKQDWYILLMILASFVLGAYFYPRLPARVPIHWDSAGHVNGYGSRFTGAFVTPLTNLGLYIVFLIVPAIDPRSKNYEKFRGSYQIIKCLLVAMLLVMQTCALLTATGVRININIVTGIAVSVLFILFGNVMGRFRHNYFVGIKTPWALANEDVWRKTHRLAGPLWVLGGIANLILTLLGNRFEAVGLIIIIVIIVVIPYAYSYLVFRKIKHGEQ
jgi:uncharacterized membrane protein